MQIQVDTREKPQAIGKILRQFFEKDVQVLRSKMAVGDYMSLANPKKVIDRKADLQELCQNVCQQHRRFRAELELAQSFGIKVIILCSHSPDITCLSDVKKWQNPRIAKSPKATTGEQLYKILLTIQAKYEVDFVFCTKAECGLKIIELLGGI